MITTDSSTGAVASVGSLPFLSGFPDHTNALAFTPAAPTHLIRYFSNLDVGDSVINIANTGANAAGSICVNVYAFAPDEQEISCCPVNSERAQFSIGQRRPAQQRADLVRPDLGCGQVGRVYRPGRRLQCRDGGCRGRRTRQYRIFVSDANSVV